MTEVFCRGEKVLLIFVQWMKEICIVVHFLDSISEICTQVRKYYRSEKVLFLDPVYYSAEVKQLILDVYTSKLQ